MRFVALLFFFIFSICPAYAAQNIEAVQPRCSTDINAPNIKDIMELTALGLSTSPKDFVCITYSLWKEGRLDNLSFLEGVPEILKTKSEKTEGLQIYVLKQTLSLEHNTIEQQEPFQKLGDIYANPQSDFYNLKDAERFYLYSHMISLYWRHTPEFCRNGYQNYPSDLIKNDLHKAVLDKMYNYCIMSDEELFQIATDYELGQHGISQDSFIALALYKALYSRLLQYDNWNFQEKIRDRIDILEKINI